MSNSIELKAPEAIELLEAIEDTEGVKSFIEGETRKGVLAAAEARITALSPDSGSGGGATETVISFSRWMYHPDREPRVFKAGEVVGDGWTESPKGIVGKLWLQDISGKWERMK